MGMGYDRDGRTKAIVFNLAKYKAGITMLKQNPTGILQPSKQENHTTRWFQNIHNSTL